MLKYEAKAKCEKQLPKVPGEARPTSEFLSTPILKTLTLQVTNKYKINK